jgi:GH35 family endo-1,4-beta-xylanase
MSKTLPIKITFLATFLCLFWGNISLAQNLLSNPGFELGSGDNFTNWAKTNGATYLTATTAPTEIHGGTRALKSAGPGFAGQQYQVQLVGDAAATTIGSSYTFKIWIKAATAGGTVRFSTQPSAMYSADMSVPDGVWTQLSWTFTANVASTQIALDLGQSNVVYFIDDAELALSPVNLVPNASFENGSGDIFTNWTKQNGASYLTATTTPAEVHAGSRALKSAGPGFAGQQYQVQLLSDAIPTTIGTSYTFKIWVKAATAGGTIRFSSQPSALYSADLSVPDGVWTQLSWTFTANVANTQIALDLGQSNVVYYLDDMEMLGSPAPAPTVNLTNFAPNFSFEDGTGNMFTNWTELNGAGSFFETTVAGEVKVGLRALKVISAIADPGNPWKVQLGSAYLNTPIGKNFSYSIYIKVASGTGKVRISTISPLANYGAYGYSATTDIGTEWQKITLNFVPVEATTRIAIDLGGAANTYFVDDLKLTSSDAIIVANGDFELGAGDNFYNWQKTNGAAFLTSTTTETQAGTRALRAEVTGTQANAGQPWSVQIKNDAVATTVGNQYTFSVWAKAAAAGGQIRFSTDPSPQYSANFDVTTEWKKFSWTITANTTATNFLLDIGKDAGVYFIDDISIVPAVANLIVNGSFELGTANDFTNWGKWNGAANITATTTLAEVNEGARAVKVINPAAGNPWEVQLVSDPMATVVDKNYIATIYVKSMMGGELIRYSTNATAGAQYGPDFTTTTGWTAMTWTFKANDASTRIVLDMGKSAGTFYVDNITVVEADACAIKYQIPAGQTPIATGKNKFLGMIYSSAQSPNLNKYFNQVTPENSGKWASIEGTEGVYNFTEVDAAREYAKVNNFPFRFHVLVWGNQQPAWLKPMTDPQKVTKIKAWFQAVANHFDGSTNARAKLEYIEVANEIINDPPSMGSNGVYSDNTNDSGSGGYVNALKSLNVELGTTPSEWDWVVNAFKLARQYFPCETKLVLNEFNAETNYLNITDKYVEIINLLKADNLIDVAGLQAHSFSTRKYNAGQSFEDHTLFLKSKIDQIAETNIPLMITELDIDGDTDDTYTVTSDKAISDAFQKSEYERIFGLYWNHPSVIGITLWGWRTGHWRTDQKAYLIDPCSEDERPALKEYLNNTLANNPSSVRASANPALTATRAPGQCGPTAISPAKAVVCPSGSVVLTASGCTGSITWSGGTSGSTTSVTVSPTKNTVYVATCSTGGTVAVEVKIAPNTNVIASDIKSGTQFVKVVQTIESAKNIGDLSYASQPNVAYEAGNSISLLPGFKAENGSVFKAEIKTCN